jgi:hypothetical protein
MEPRGGMVSTTSRVAARTRSVKRRAEAMRFNVMRYVSPECLTSREEISEALGAVFRKELSIRLD